MDYMHEEIAALLGVSRGAVSVAVHRGRDSLRAALTACGAVAAAVWRQRPRPAAAPALTVAGLTVVLVGVPHLGTPVTLDNPARGGARFVPRDVPESRRAQPAGAGPTRLVAALRSPAAGARHNDAAPRGRVADVRVRTRVGDTCVGIGGNPCPIGDTIHVVVPGSLAGLPDHPIEVQRNARRTGGSCTSARRPSTGRRIPATRSHRSTAATTRAAPGGASATRAGPTTPAATAGTCRGTRAASTASTPAPGDYFIAALPGGRLYVLAARVAANGAYVHRGLYCSTDLGRTWRTGGGC